MKSLCSLFITCIALVFSSAIALGQGGSTQVSCEFTNLYGAGGSDLFSDLYHRKSTNQYYVGGVRSGNALICIIDSTGNLVLSKGLQIGSIVRSLTKAENNSDLLIVTTQNNSVQITRISALGVLRWSKQYNSDKERFAKIVPASNNTYYVATWYNQTASDDDLIIMKIDGIGNIIWSKKFDYGDDEFNWMIPTETGGLMVAGGTSSTFFEQFILELDETGNVVQSKLISDPNMQSSKIFKIVQDNDDDFVATGMITSNAQTDVFVMKLDPSLNISWVKTLGLPGNNSGIGLDVDLNNNIYASFDHTIATDPFGAVCKFTPTGNFLWAKYIDGFKAGNLMVNNSGGIDNIFIYSGIVDHAQGIGGLDACLIKEDLEFNGCVNQSLTPTVSSHSFTSTTWSYSVSNFSLGTIFFSTSVTTPTVLVASVCDTCQTLTGVSEDESIISKFSVYPVPSQSEITIALQLRSNSSADIRIVDLLGRSVKELSKYKLGSGDQEINLDLSGFSKGMYYVQLLIDGQVNSKKILLE